MGMPALIATAMLSIVFCLFPLANPAHSADIYADVNVDYTIEWSSGSAHSIVAPVAEWRFADGLDWDSTGSGIYRDYGSVALAVGLQDGNQPGLGEGVVSAGQSSLIFDGINDFLTAGDDTLFDFKREDFFVEVWMRTETTAWLETWGSHIVAKHQQGVFNGWGLSINKDTGSGKICFKASGSSEYLWDVESVATVNDGEWHHIVAVRDYSDVSTGISIYIDGSLDNSGGQTQASLSNAYTLTIGADHGGDQGLFDGQIDLVRIFRQSLPVDVGDMVDSLYFNRPTGSITAPYPSIQASLLAASSGDLIYALPGIYPETVEFDVNAALTSFERGVGRRAVIFGAGLPLSAGNVGLAVSGAAGISYLNLHGFIEAGEIGMTVSSAVDNVAFHHLTFDSCRTGVQFTGSTASDSVHHCTFESYGYTGSCAMRSLDGSASADFTIVLSDNIIAECDSGVVCGTYADLTLGANNFYDVANEFTGATGGLADTRICPRFRGKDFCPITPALRNSGAWLGRMSLARRMQRAEFGNTRRMR